MGKRQYLDNTGQPPPSKRQHKQNKPSNNSSNTKSDETSSKRPDVAKRLLERKKIIETCQKASLTGRVCPEWNPTDRDVFLSLLRTQVRSVSEITVRGSLIVNEVVLFYLEHGNTTKYKRLPPLSQSFFNACFLQGIKQTSKASKELKECIDTINDIYTNEFNIPDLDPSVHQHLNYPVPKRSRGDIQAITIAAKRFRTNFLVNLTSCFFKRQQTFITTWLKNNKLDKSVSTYDVQCLINGWIKKKRSSKNTETELYLPESMTSFIQDQRNLLGNPKDLTFDNRKDPWMILKYLYQILQYYDTQGIGKGFSLTPVTRIGLHYMTIDSTVLHEILINVSSDLDTRTPEWLQRLMSVPRNKIHHQDVRDVMWFSTFNIDGLRHKRRFNYQIDTDGYTMTVHFVMTKKSKSKRAKRRRFHMKSKMMDTSVRTISIDPGRSNLVMARDSQTQKYTKLTRRGYRKAVGFDKFQERSAFREIPLRGIVASLSKTSIRTCNRVKTYMYRQTIIRNYSMLWSVRTVGSRCRDRFTTFIRKNSVLDRFFSNLGKTIDPESGKMIFVGPKPVVVYGAATIHPNGKGELSVPVKYVHKVCTRHFHTTYANEYLTTKVCNTCHMRLHPVANKSREHRRGGYPVRGLLWCQTCKKFVNRDKNAAKNIDYIYRAGIARPEAFRFGQKKQVMKKLVILPTQLCRLKKNRTRDVSKGGQRSRRNANGKTSHRLKSDNEELPETFLDGVTN